jgi:hypothetical protein
MKGRDDFLVVLDNGAIWTWINHRGYNVGLAPVWVPMGQTSIGANINVRNASEVVHGKVRGTKRHDYTHVTDNVTLAGFSGFANIDLYANEGSKGLYQKGDGCRYCDMRGIGADDYIWMRSDGAIHLFGNRHEPPYWDDLGDLPFPFPEVRALNLLISLAHSQHPCACFMFLPDIAPISYVSTSFLLEHYQSRSIGNC